TCFIDRDELQFTSDRRGPKFAIEPPSKVDFLNSTGTVIHCSAKGSPLPSITWVKQDGSALLDLPSLRQIGTDGSLVFLPFAASEYRQDVHFTVYKCIATNTVGLIESRSVRVRASGRYTVFPSGELHIHQVDPVIDGQHQYRCQTKHRLSGEIKLSASSGRLIITGKKKPNSNVSPRIIEGKNLYFSEVGDKVILPCVGQGFPVPTFSWIKVKDESFNEIVRIEENAEFRVFQRNGILIIKQSQISDSGKYHCIANNSVGKAHFETILVVKAPIAAFISPQVLRGQEGEESVRFNCTATGHPINKIVWKKDGRVLNDVHKYKFYESVLIIKNLKREDRGIYQCFVFNDYENVQSSAELILADDPPKFSYVFSDASVERGIDEDQYKCTASNKAAESASSDVFVKVIVAPLINPFNIAPNLREGMRSMLTCSVLEGDPPFRLSWFKDDKPIEVNNNNAKITSSDEFSSTLVINKVSFEDNGNYTCVVTNSAASANYSVNMLVK
ncbi:Down syndrome cell adhesion molecule-like protein Dscam2 isoform X39, partial [Dinothrombium tinctorium]